jgi:hypothetical protein
MANLLYLTRQQGREMSFQPQVHRSRFFYLEHIDILHCGFILFLSNAK